MAAKMRKRTRGSRRGTPGCLSVLFLFVCIIAAMVAAVFIFFKMRTIEVVGVEHYAPEQVVAASGAETGSNLIFMSKSKMIHGIFADLPYVKEVRVNRALPDRLVITVSETHAVAYIDDDGVYWVIDPEGKILERTLQRPEGIMHIDGVLPMMPAVGDTIDFGEESDLRLRTFVTTVRALERADYIDAVQSINLGGLYDVRIRVVDRFDVSLGAPEDLDYKLEFMREVIENKLRPNQKGSLDLSSLMEKGEARFLEDY